MANGEATLPAAVRVNAPAASCVIKAEPSPQSAGCAVFSGSSGGDRASAHDRGASAGLNVPPDVIARRAGDEQVLEFL
ncbi:MAG: hypothetical protein ABSE69_12820, partial [Roseiarcus sp.]